MLTVENASTEELLAAIEAAGVELPKEKYLGGILTHNGIFTVKSMRTGDHRTFRVRTQPAKSNFAPGKRVLGLLTGSDNTSDYTNFAFVTDDGIKVWEKKRTQAYLAYADMLMRLAEHSAAGKVEVYAATNCRICNRPLTTPESVSSGIGPICEGRVS